MALSTYTELRATVADYLARSDLTTAIPDYIRLAEAKLNRDLKCRQMETRSTTVTDTGDDEPEFISLPSDFQAMRRIRLSSVTGKPRLDYLSGAQADEFRSYRANTTGQPTHFTIMGDELELLPTPALEYTIEMVYRKYIPALATNETNWLLTLAPDVYLYGALMEAAPHLHEDERIQTWSQGFNGVIDELNRMSMTAAFNAGPMAISVTGYNP